MVIPLRVDFHAVALRAAARRTKDAAQTRRPLALASAVGAAAPDRQHVRHPAPPDEAGRGKGWPARRPGRAVHLAQGGDGTQERRDGRHAAELEGVEESRRPAVDAGVVLAEQPAATASRPPPRSRGTAPGDHRVVCIR